MEAARRISTATAARSGSPQETHRPGRSRLRPSAWSSRCRRDLSPSRVAHPGAATNPARPRPLFRVRRSRFAPPADSRDAPPVGPRFPETRRELSPALSLVHAWRHNGVLAFSPGTGRLPSTAERASHGANRRSVPLPPEGSPRASRPPSCAGMGAVLSPFRTAAAQTQTGPRENRLVRLDLFRRHISGCADHHARSRQRRPRFR